MYRKSPGCGIQLKPKSFGMFSISLSSPKKKGILRGSIKARRKRGGEFYNLGRETLVRSIEGEELSADERNSFRDLKFACWKVKRNNAGKRGKQWKVIK